MNNILGQARIMLENRLRQFVKLPKKKPDVVLHCGCMVLPTDKDEDAMFMFIEPGIESLANAVKLKLNGEYHSCDVSKHDKAIVMNVYGGMP